mgnify:CR=1 FL=1
MLFGRMTWPRPVFKLKGMTDNATETEEMKKRLLSEREALLAASLSDAEGRKPVELDQASVGRLSRMDAMQRQAMASETQRRRQQRRHRLEQALKRIEAGEYFYCSECGAEIPAARLELLPFSTHCVRCAEKLEDKQD